MQLRLLRNWRAEQIRRLEFWLAYYLLWSAIWFSTPMLLDIFGNPISLWYPSAGLRFFVLFAFGRAALLPVLLTEVTLEMGLWWLKSPLVAVSLLSLVDPLESAITPVASYGIAALGLRAWNAGRISDALADLAAIIRLLIAAGLASGLATLSGVSRLWYLGLMPSTQLPEVAFSWLIGDFIGVITVTPLLMWQVQPRLQQWLRQGCWLLQSLPGNKHRWHWLTYFLALLLMLWMLFSLPEWVGRSAMSRPFLILLVLPPLAWGMVTGGLSIATSAIFGLNIELMLLVATSGHRELAVDYQIVMIAIALVGLPLGAAIEARRQALDGFRDLSRISNDLLWTINTSGQLARVQGKLVQTLALRLGQRWRCSVYSIPLTSRIRLREAVQTHQPFREVLVCICTRTSGLCWLQISGRPYWDRLHHLMGYYGTATDVTVRYQAEQILYEYAERLQREVAIRTAQLWETNQQLTLSERRYRTMLATAPIGVAEVDTAGCCQYVNFAWCLLLNLQSTHEALGRVWWECVHPEVRTEMERLWQMSRQLHVGDSEFPGPAQRYLGVQWSALYDGSGVTRGALVMLTDLTERRQREQENWRLAHFDGLTQLPNRLLFWDRLEQALRLANRYSQLVAVLWLDLDGFKAINDTLGHAAGDELLHQVGQRLQAGLRDSDTAARLGGDEFAVMLTTVLQVSDATCVANKIIDLIQASFILSQGPAHVSVSIGIALYPDHADTASELVRCADQAMYAAKQAGKSCWRLWNALDDGVGRERPDRMAR
ncbi:MAG: diguanylate cyclase [Gammaproteobacteria bacterium]|nr:diguanylate cyclase [Gammaproteobacteria bacterium]